MKEAHHLLWQALKSGGGGGGEKEGSGGEEGRKERRGVEEEKEHGGGGGERRILTARTPHNGLIHSLVLKGQLPQYKLYRKYFISLCTCCPIAHP